MPCCCFALFSLLSPILLSLVALALPVACQTVELTVALDDGDPATADKPFGVTLDPDGIHAYVALIGDFVPCGEPASQWPLYCNDKIQKIDLTTGSVVAQATVGYCPEDIALTRDAGGQTRHLYVTNGTSGSITCLTPSLQVVQTIPMTPCPSSFCGPVFAFGITASPDGSRVYAQGTACAEMDVIDSDPVSPTFNTLLSSFTVPDMFGRMDWLDADTLVIPVTAWNGTGQSTGIAVVPVANPTNQQTWLPVTSADFPQITDLAVLPSGLVVAAVGYGLTPLVVEIDPANGTVTRQLDLASSVGTALHGLALSPDGKTVAVTSFTNNQELVLVDLASFSVVSITSTSLPGTPITLPNEVAFTRDGSRVVVTLQEGRAFQVYADLPSFDLELDVSPQNPSVGSPATLAVVGVESGRRAVVFASFGNGPQTLGSHTVLLSDPFYAIAEGLGDVSGEAWLPVLVPSDPAWSGITLQLQAGTTDLTGLLRVSNGIAVTIM